MLEPDHEKTCLMSYTNAVWSAPVLFAAYNISSFCNHISSLMLASVAEQASLSLTWSETPEDTFSHDEAHLYFAFYIDIYISHFT